MKIGGLIKSSMIDYPGRISCVVFTVGCNLKCPYCHNPSLIKPAGSADDTGYDSGSILDFLKTRQGLLEGVVVTGGEPTLQKGLVGFCESVKELGFDLKIDTNGTRPEIIRTLIDRGLADYIAMDIKAVPSEYAPHIAYKFDSGSLFESVDVIMNGSVSYEFRTTCVKPFVNEAMIRETAEMISGASLYALQSFTPENIFNPEYFADKKEMFTRRDLEEFRALAGEYVQSCIIR